VHEVVNQLICNAAGEFRGKRLPRCIEKGNDRHGDPRPFDENLFFCAAGCVLAGGGGLRPEHGDVIARSKINAKWVVLARGLVVFLQLDPQTACLGANDRVLGGMVRRLAIIHLCADDIFLESVFRTADRVFHREPEKSAQPFRLRKDWALQHARKLRANQILRKCASIRLVHSSISSRYGMTTLFSHPAGQWPGAREVAAAVPFSECACPGDAVP